MKAIVYLPISDEDKTALMQKVATVHAEAVVIKLSSLPLPKEKSKLLINEIRATVSTT